VADDDGAARLLGELAGFETEGSAADGKFSSSHKKLVQVLTVQGVLTVLRVQVRTSRTFEPFEPLELFPNVQWFDQVRVSLGVFQLQVVEQAAALADEHQEAAAGVVILGV